MRKLLFVGLMMMLSGCASPEKNVTTERDNAYFWEGVNCAALAAEDLAPTNFVASWGDVRRRAAQIYQERRKGERAKARKR